MKTKKILLAIGLFGASFASALLIGRGNAFAATKTWTGAGSDKKFSTGANWSDSSAPVSGDSIVLPSDLLFTGCTNGSSPVTLNNDLDPNTITLASLSVTGGKPQNCYSNFKISGNMLKLSGNLTGSPQGKYEMLYIPAVEITSDVTISNVVAEATIAIGAHNLVFQAANSSAGLTGSGNVTMADNMSGGSGGGCWYTGSFSTSFEFGGDNSGFSGSLTLKNAMLFIDSRANSLARKASRITLDDGSMLFYLLANNADEEYNKPLTINSGTLHAYQLRASDQCGLPIIKTLTLSGDVTLATDTEVDLDYANIDFTGSVTGKEHLKLNSGGNGSLIFADGSTVKSEQKVVTIDKEEECSEAYQANSTNSKLIINADCSKYSSFTNPEYPFEIEGILAGVGKVGHIKIMNGGVIAPGHSPGTLTTANIEWQEGGIYEFEIGKDGADQIIANGTVTLGNGTLKVLRFENYAPKAGDAYTIIANDGTDAVNGTFKDLPEGATFKTEDGGVYKISYKGGDGNDVVVTVVTAPKVPNTGFNMLKNNPLLTFSITIVATGLIVVIARKRALHKA